MYQALVNEDVAEHMMATTQPSAKQWLFTMKESISHEAFMKLSMTLWRRGGREKSYPRK